jgi:hypothetical protein
VVLTEGLRQAGTRWRMAGDKGQAVKTIGARGEGRRRGAPSFWSPRVDSWGSCKGSMGVREVRGSPAARNRRGGAGYRRRSSGSILARAGLGVESGSLGKLPGGEAELLRVLAGAGVHRSDGYTAAQRLGAAEQNGATTLGFGAAAG